MRCGTIACHFRDCKALLVTSLTHVGGAIASVQTFTFTFTDSTAHCRSAFNQPKTERKAKNNVCTLVAVTEYVATRCVDF